jgi:hypothetical protein
MFARNEQRTLPHRRHHHLINEEAPSSLYFTQTPRTLPCSRNLYPAPTTLHLASSQNLPDSYSMASVCPEPAHPAAQPLVPAPHPHADCLQQAPNQPRPYSGNFLPNGGAPSGPVPGAVPLDPNRGRVIQQGSVRVLCIADVRGRSNLVQFKLIPD